MAQALPCSSHCSSSVLSETLAAMSLAIAEPESLSLSDGTSVTVSKTPGMAAEEWKETKKMLEENP
eukprot:CAMPEP_0171206748 /NCGR_PEP_ID=MMETSP0790-20130122/27221_1 /TAXON_ID=2925 /ORGANISM="Alexandrium catenella, Strain OF101" /LENGTH=65 /DNA_ID=CAMNT_0011672299 /DNA_START=8 /DNA_END=202 /DNA_ORIENTATION=+